MYRYDDLLIRRFGEDDIESKIRWINSMHNNKYLHYDLPLEYGKTKKWYEKTKGQQDRYDGIIEYNSKPVGIIGLINIDEKNRKAEDYMVIGETDIQGKGIGTRSGMLILAYAFLIRGLHKVYAYVEALA